MTMRHPSQVSMSKKVWYAFMPGAVSKLANAAVRNKLMYPVLYVNTECVPMKTNLPSWSHATLTFSFPSRAQ